MKWPKMEEFFCFKMVEWMIGERKRGGCHGEAGVVAGEHGREQ